MGENGLDAAQHAALMALTRKELPIQASLLPPLPAVVVQHSMRSMTREQSELNVCRLRGQPRT